MRRSLAVVVVSVVLAGVAVSTELTLGDIHPQGDGPDKKGNTADDTWRFWFELAHKPGHFHPLDTYSTSVPKTGINKKVRGPIAAHLPSPEHSEGWIFHRDWDGRFEGVWADRKLKQIIAYPYVEKSFHGAVAISCRIATAGRYDISGALTDLQVAPQFPQHDGIEWTLELARDGAAGKKLASGGPIGDGHGRPDSGTFAANAVDAIPGDLIRLIIRPRKWWGSDMTRIDAFQVLRK